MPIEFVKPRFKQLARITRAQRLAHPVMVRAVHAGHSARGAVQRFNIRHMVAGPEIVAAVLIDPRIGVPARKNYDAPVGKWSPYPEYRPMLTVQIRQQSGQVATP